MLACAAGAIVTLLVSRNKTLAGWLAFLAIAASSLLTLNAAAAVFLQGPERVLTLINIPAASLSLRIYIDGLSAFFLLLIAVMALLAALYSITYMQHYADYGVRQYYPNLLLFVAGMYGMVSMTNMMVFFCIFWQIMTLSSYMLVRYEGRKAENVRAANKYLLMMQLACALIMLGAGVLAGDGVVLESGEVLARYDADALSYAIGHMPAADSWKVTLALVLFLLGFGIKAGMWPFGQIWLPDAHPAAPSPVSALLSGVMIKTGVYGLLRSFLWMIPAYSLERYNAPAWGCAIALLGTVTLFVGTTQALKQIQSKRLLAYHSIGQIGYILLGLGTCLALIKPGMQAENVMLLATVGLYGALFHTMNHALFKGLLFFNAGSVLYATGTQNLNRLGGLMKYMPLTAAATLIASCSIAGVPLFNGFASKWSIYSAAILGSGKAGYLAVCAVFAILTSALTLASFMKLFGAAFLARISSLVRERVAGRPVMEVGLMMMLPQAVLALLCILLGLMPMAAYQLIGRCLAASPPGLATVLARGALPAAGGIGAGVMLPAAGAVFAPLALLLVLAALLMLAAWFARLGQASRRADEPWLCGYVNENELNRYGAHNLYSSVKQIVGWSGASPDRPHPRKASGR
jgi:formate hydrogenlyase subunit 3/multisubunit Na+/H+ antiporter MnhD subunit